MKLQKPLTMAGPVSATKTTAVNTDVAASFFAKILLFGEYGILHNSMGLSIPYTDMAGELSFPGDHVNRFDPTSNEKLKEFGAYLIDLQQQGALQFKLDAEALQSDLKQDMYFQSTIPQGFGVGSSGAICAAFYDRYAMDALPRETNDVDGILKLKAIFSQMEGWFHGKSSGLDPLICYLNDPVWVRSAKDLQRVTLPITDTGRGAIFLLDSGKPCRTGPLVNWFMDQMKKPDYATRFIEELVPKNNACIKMYLADDVEGLLMCVERLSAYQHEHMRPMIPDTVVDLWATGLETEAFSLKLCGSGGGGYLLGFTHDLEAARPYLDGFDIKVVRTI